MRQQQKDKTAGPTAGPPFLFVRVVFVVLCSVLEILEPHTQSVRMSTPSKPLSAAGGDSLVPAPLSPGCWECTDRAGVIQALGKVTVSGEPSPGRWYCDMCAREVGAVMACRQCGVTSVVARVQSGLCACRCVSLSASMNHLLISESAMKAASPINISSPTK